MNKQICVGCFAGYLPHYRLGVYTALSRAKENQSFTVCVPEDSPDRFHSAFHENVEFPRRFDKK